MSQYDYTREHPGVKSSDTSVAEPIPGKIAHPEERATELGARVVWQDSLARAEPEPEREDHS